MLPEMGHHIASAYNKVCIDLTRYGFSKTFFPLRNGQPQNPTGHIICIRLISQSLHSLHVYLKLGFPIPQTTPEWTTHSTNKVETWQDNYLDRLEEFTKLCEIERK